MCSFVPAVHPASGGWGTTPERCLLYLVGCFDREKLNLLAVYLDFIWILPAPATAEHAFHFTTRPRELAMSAEHLVSPVKPGTTSPDLDSLYSRSKRVENDPP